MRTIRNTVTASIGLLGLAFSAHAFELPHQNGVLSLESTPQKVISFELAHLDTLNALGIEPVGVPQSVYGGALEKYNQSPVVGTLFEPDYEQVAALQPDLIIAGGRSAAAIPELQKIASTVSFNTDPGDFLNSVKSTTLALGQAWDKKEQAEELLNALEDNVKNLRDINQGKTGILLFTINGRLIPHAPGDRFGYVYELTGLDSVLPARRADELNQPRPQPDSPEAKAAARKNQQELSAIAQADPDWIIMLDRGAINDGEKTAQATLQAHPELGKTSAVQQGQVYYAEPNSWYIVTGGVDNLTRITADMQAAMQ